MPFMISGDKLFNILYISLARVLKISFMDCDRMPLENVFQMLKNDHYKLFLIHSHEFFYVLSVSYKLSRLVNNMQIVNFF